VLDDTGAITAPLDRPGLGGNNGENAAHASIFLGNECVDLSLGRVALQKPGAHEPKMPNASKFRATRPRTEDADVHVNFGSKPTLMERAGLAAEPAAQSGHAPKQRRLPSHERKCATAIGSSQPVQTPPTEAAKRKA
jgi:hypothetical protein